ncbi:hypothetical protein M440DRAFT_1393343 [Trichoderma longibrachiatum ATCC 18648]|uniref:Uncharacterized protein n=1 Tax=Trichoderma longibrachiatum ATCC 18648 TaxID=983965 RepID=A0A2T4BY72_TRILO|nr:hypothetical protein M440DRAFT_1393343 [Trichoderma longibrachiatum ATCC 18648]
MDQQPNNGVSDVAAAPIPDTNGGVPGLNPALAVPTSMPPMMMPGQAFIGDPSLGTTSLPDAPATAPFMYSNGNGALPDKAITAEQLAQDVINVLGQKQQPIQNMVIFDGTTMEAPMYPLHPEGTLGANLLSMGGGGSSGIVDPLTAAAAAAATAPPPNGSAMVVPPGMATSMGLDASGLVVPPLDPTTAAAGMPMGVDLTAPTTSADMMASVSVAPPTDTSAQVSFAPTTGTEAAPPTSSVAEPQAQVNASDNPPTDAPPQTTQ